MGNDGIYTSKDGEVLPDEAEGSAPPRGRLAGRRIVVIGGGTQTDKESNHEIGNGRAISLLAAREGAHVLCVDRSGEAAQRTVELIEGAGGSATPIVADVTSSDDCDRLAEATVDGSPPDGVVLNVGVTLGRAIESTSLKDWDRVIETNLTGHFRVIRALWPVIADGCSVVFIGSVAGILPGTYAPAYDTSKAGLIGLCRHVALEGGRRSVRANTVIPGLIDSPLGQRLERERASRGRVKAALGRYGTPWEVAYAVIFLLSQESSYVTGQILAVDGGLAWAR